MLMLRKKKFQETLLDKTDKQLENIERMVGIPSCSYNIAESFCCSDVTLVLNPQEELIKRLNEWKENVESKGMRVNMNKTKVMVSYDKWRTSDGVAEGC